MSFRHVLAFWFCHLPGAIQLHAACSSCSYLRFRDKFSLNSQGAQVQNYFSDSKFRSSVLNSGALYNHLTNSWLWFLEPWNPNDTSHPITERLPMHRYAALLCIAMGGGRDWLSETFDSKIWFSIWHLAVLVDSAKALFEYCLTYSASFKCSFTHVLLPLTFQVWSCSRLFYGSELHGFRNGIRRKHREGVEGRGRGGPDEPEEPVLVVPNVRSRAREPSQRRSQLSEPQLGTVTNALGVFAGESIHCRGMAGAFWQHGSLSRFSCLLRCRNNSDVELTDCLFLVGKWALTTTSPVGWCEGQAWGPKDRNGSNVIQPCTKFESQFISVKWFTIPRLSQKGRPRVLVCWPWRHLDEAWLMMMVKTGWV